MALKDMRAHGKSSIEDAVKAVPPRPRDFLARSLVLLLGLTTEKWERALKLAADAFDSSFSADEAELAKELAVSVGDARQIISAATFFGAMLASHPEASSEQFVASLIENKLLVEADRLMALKFSEVVARARVELTEEFDKSSLRNTLLPSLRKFDTVVDIRLSPTDVTPVLAVPVVLLMVDTDAERETLWCQLSKNELKAVIAKLSKTLERVEAAESWISARDGSEA